MKPPEIRRLAVVTGGTRGIGRAISLRLSELGYEVVAIARHSSGEEPFEVIRCDLADPVHLEATLGSLGRIEVLVNNAGSSMSAKIETTSLDDWERLMRLNATAVFVGVRAVLSAMREADRGRIVTIASTASLEGGPYVSAYTASKHAALGLMRVVAAEVAGTNIAAATICPTFVRTEMTESTIRTIAEKTGSSLEAAEARLAALTPHGRLVTADEVADAVSALLALPAKAMNGEVVVVDGRIG